ncbi:MAG: hypothetical protein KKG69_05695 [Alphaproteobacteria bacterium]|uniref:hypothetical protein n=1 Tax=Brevundimonas sp. TaxID=1871086 RepID=UPI003563095F|nr:hypothetical protein [Alphaproteobacteria bacterium]MBU2163536.1 hypothetical protein [Alphaproteobacteria bacterium]MBU2230752.1 hypothetical protein [Alphaproteobacteria bacterium]
MISVILKVLVAGAGFASATSWLYGGKTVSREQELNQRRRNAERSSEPFSLAGVNILDGDTSYDLIATLRHQSQWNRAGAILAAIAILIQTLDSLTAD